MDLISKPKNIGRTDRIEVEIDKTTVIVRAISTSLSIIEKLGKKKIGSM